MKDGFTDQPSYEREWHLDKKVPIALIGVLVAQTIAVGIWAGGISQRVTELERQAAVNAPQGGQILVLQTKVDAISGTLTEIKTMLRGREARP